MKFSVLLLSPLLLLLLLVSSRDCRGASVKSKLSCALGLNRKDTIGGEELLAQLIEPYLDLQTTDVGKYVTFTLFTKENDKGELIKPNDGPGLRRTSFNFNRPTKIITHGYFNWGTSPSCVLMQKAYLSSGDYNVIVVDWWGMQSILGWIPLTYSRVVQYVPQVSEFVTSMLEFLESQGLDLKSTCLLGHSLGAHIMGTASHRMRNRVGYIVGLDPALPMYEDSGPGERLSTEDATTVEVIHTNEGRCGFSAEIGHYDFYPNGGSNQPGCLTNPCAHGRAYEYYAEAISSENGFFGRRCSDFGEVKGGNCTGGLAKMGGLRASQLRWQRSGNWIGGMYHFETRNSSPYAKGI